EGGGEEVGVAVGGFGDEGDVDFRCSAFAVGVYGSDPGAGGFAAGIAVAYDDACRDVRGEGVGVGVGAAGEAIGPGAVVVGHDVGTGGAQGGAYDPFGMGEGVAVNELGAGGMAVEDGAVVR